MFLLLVILISFLFFGYIIDNRDIMSPSVLYIAGFIVAVTAASMNIHEWGINLSLKTILIIIVGNFSFLFGNILYKLLHKNNYTYDNIEEIKEIRIDNWKTIIVIMIGLATIVSYYSEIVRLSYYADSYWQQFGVMVAYKKVISYGNVSINTFVNQLTKVVYSFGYIYSYVFINNVFALQGKKFRENLMNLFPVILYIIMSILKGNRIDIMGLVVLFVFFYYYFLHKRLGWNAHLSGRVLKNYILVVIVGIIAFYYMKDLVGRVSSLKFIDYITQYVGGSIELLDLYIKGDLSQIDSTFLGETLTGLLNGLKKFGFFHFEIRKQLEFRYTPTGIYLGNVYTALRRYYHDGSWFGLMLFPMLLSYFMNKFYENVKKYSCYHLGDVFKIIVYGSLLYILPFQAMEDLFWISKVSIGYVIELIILYVCLKFTFVKIKI